MADYDAIYRDLANDPHNVDLIERLHAAYLEGITALGATTSDGAPYPLPTDPIAQGADAIRALAEWLTGTTWAKIDEVAPTALAGSYPARPSLMLATSSAWPTQGAFVITFRMSGTSATVQLCARGSSGVTPIIYLRIGTTNGWSDWWGGAGPFGEAAGVVAFPSTAAGDTKSVTVTLPSSRFTASPAVNISAISGVPSMRLVSASTITSTSFVAFYTNAGTASSGVSASWFAVQMSSTSTAALFALADDAGQIVVVSCPNEACPEFGLEISATVSYLDDDGVEQTVDAVECGECGTMIYDADADEVTPW